MPSRTTPGTHPIKLHIYTIPKAGTYFIADLVERLGFENTGMHVAIDSFLNTKKFPIEINAQFPSRTVEKQSFVRTLRSTSDNQVTFGHFPAPLAGWMFPKFSFICSYRHPRKTLMSEFLDFRFRRRDVHWISPEAIPNDNFAFCTYLERHGRIQMSIFSEMIGVSVLVNEPAYKSLEPDRVHFLNFDALLSDPDISRSLAAWLGADPLSADQALEATRQSETKTKATDLEIDRASLWCERADEMYHALGAEEIVRRGKELGWHL